MSEAGRWTRRRLIGAGLGAVVGLGGAGTAAVELVEHGVLPGRHWLERLTGGCDAAAPDLTFGPLGTVHTGRFRSRYRRHEVSYRIAYPHGYERGDRLALVVYLHADGGSFASPLGQVSLAQALAARRDGVGLAPMAIVSVDGGNLYWNPHPGDDPMGMVVHELIPMCQALGLGRSPERIGAIGISMGGYGVLLLAERHRHLLAAVAAISPAVWTSYAQARAVNAGAFASRADFEADDVVTHASALAGLPVRVASGENDPFHPGVVALAHALPAGATVDFAHGCHDGAFFASQAHPSLEFLGRHMTTT